MRLKHSLPEITARLIVTFFGLFMLALGIDLTILADLGTDALTSPALAASTLLKPHYPILTVGNTLICLHVLLILAQIDCCAATMPPCSCCRCSCPSPWGSWWMRCCPA